MTETILGLSLGLLILNILGLHAYFIFKSRAILIETIKSVPSDLSEVVHLRNEELKAVRKAGQKISFKLAALTLKLGELLLDERDDLWNSVAPQRFEMTKTWYRSFQIWNLAIAGQGIAARIVGVAAILVFVVSFWGIVGVIISSLIASQFESQLGTAMRTRENTKAA